MGRSNCRSTSNGTEDIYKYRPWPLYFNIAIILGIAQHIFKDVSGALSTLPFNLDLATMKLALAVAASVALAHGTAHTTLITTESALVVASKTTAGPIDSALSSNLERRFECDLLDQVFASVGTSAGVFGLLYGWWCNGKKCLRPAGWTTRHGHM